GELVHDRDPEWLEVRRVSDTRHLQELRRVDRAAAEDHLACADRPAARDAPRGALPVEDDPLHEDPGAYLEVRTLHRRMEVRPRRRPPPAAPDVAVELREALLAVPVDIVGQRVARLLDGGEEGVEQRPFGGTALEDERPVAATPVVGAGEAGLHLLEVRQAMGVVPAARAALVRPALVVERVPALEDHPVDRARAAEDLS